MFNRPITFCFGRVEELERSLTAMKEQQVALRDQLRQENERKKKLEGELANDHARIAELERQLSEKRRDRSRRGDALAAAADVFGDELQRGGSHADSEREHKWRWLVAEEERLVELRSAIQCQSEELEERQNILEKREKAFLEKSAQSDLVHCGASVSVSQDLTASGVRQKSVRSPITQDKVTQTSACVTETGANGADGASASKPADKEAIRREIRNMRHTRDALVIQRQELDERQHRGRELEPEEEHRLLELDEAIEAVDAAIEYKNEVICSRNRELKSPVNIWNFSVP
jgi:kinesin family member 7